MAVPGRAAGELQQTPDLGELDRLARTTERILQQADRLVAELPRAPSGRLVPMLERLIDSTVGELVPLMAAEEAAVLPRLDAAQQEAMGCTFREVRALAERLAVLLENLQRRLARGPERKPLQCALMDLGGALNRLLRYRQAARQRLSDALSAEELRRLAGRLGQSEADARARTLLIAQPEIPPTVAHHMRSRPDLHIAYPITLAELNRKRAASHGDLPQQD